MTTLHDSTAPSTTDVPAPATATDGPAPAAPPATPGTTFETLAVCGFIFGIFAIVAAVFAVGLAARAVDEHRNVAAQVNTSDANAPTPAASTLDVSLKEFAIDPADLRVRAGAVLDLTNEGAIVHNLSVDGVASDMLDPGGKGRLDLGELGPGTYRIRCDVPGHEAAGMKGTLTIE
jgi:uncharacterized cupredoxin-like copper-binding protein